MKSKETKQVNLASTNLAHLQQKLDEKNKYIAILESIIDLAPVNIFWKSINGEYQGCNNVLAKLLKLNSKTEIIGKTNFDFFDYELAKRLEKADQEIFVTGLEQAFEEQGLDANWKSATYLTRKAPLTNDKGEVIGLIGASLDITKQKEQEQELQQALEKAAIAAKAKTDFLAIMSHELRNAIGNIISALQLAMADSKEENVNAANYLILAQKTAQNILPFLENVSSYFELESGYIYSKKTPANVVETIRAAAKNHLEVKKEAVSLLLDISMDLPEQILVDNYNLYKVLDVIIYNAIRFTQEGNITIKAFTADDGYLTVVVSDTGIGISESQLKNLFNAFPISKEQNAKYRKFGLRLSIVKKILQLIDGDITVQSQEGKGTKVTVKLPFAAIDDAFLADSPAGLMEPIPLTILVVEDDPISLEMEVTLLKRLGHQVDAVASGMEAIKQALQKAYDLIFMDITLPDISGIEATKQILTKYPTVPIVAITSHSSEEAVDDLLSQGILTVIPKPISQAAFEEFFANYAKLLSDDNG